MLPNGKKEEIKYIEWYAEHKHRLTSNATSAKLFIPSHTALMVWYEKWQFNDDFMDYKHMWDRGEPLFHIPSGIVRYDEILSNKDVEVSMTLMSKRNEGEVPDSRIVEELNGGSWPVHKDAEFGDPLADYDSYGVWVKMYEHPTYIPELGTNIVAYGVMEENIPLLKDCFKYGGDKQHRRLHKGPPYFAVGGNAMKPNNVVYDPLAMKGWNVNYTTVGPRNPSIISGSQERMRLDSNGNISLSWTCNICGGDTSQVEYDYLGSGTNHLECELKETMSSIQYMEHMKRHMNLGLEL